MYNLTQVLNSIQRGFIFIKWKQSEVVEVLNLLILALPPLQGRTSGLIGLPTDSQKMALSKERHMRLHERL